ncbi:MAG: DUF4080 domain-containing protein [SAR324 cluster bacterium]|nr:DUF4080 domain-containing protein [SAR324 cluster bacterium]
MIVLTTANVKYSHSSLGLRYLYANMQELQSRTVLIEHTLKGSPQTMVDQWLSCHPTIIGMGIYIWNIDVLSQGIALLKQTHPEIQIVIGGPEVSYGVSDGLSDLVDYIIALEGDQAFTKLCRDILNNKAPRAKVLPQDPVDVKKLILPYEFYTDHDIAHRKIYVEASRGCAFYCQFCLSSLDKGVRAFETAPFLSEIKKLYRRGARQFKFVDRIFNLYIKQSIAILSFFLEEFPEQDYFLHFEVIPDRLPVALKESIAKFKEGAVQFEVGIQTFDEDVSTLIGRQQNKTKALDTLNYLRQHTNIHLHVDLIIGLPGASLDTVKEDLNQLVALGIPEIQVGILKYLKGTSIIQHTHTHQMVYEAHPPYEIKSNADLNFELMSQLKRFAKYWDHYYNSGNFIQTMECLFGVSNPFDEFFKLSEYSHHHLGKTYGIPLDQYAETLYHYLVSEQHMDPLKIRDLILKDTLIKPGRKIPRFLKDYTLGAPKIINSPIAFQSDHSLTRQRNHSIEKK